MVEYDAMMCENCSYAHPVEVNNRRVRYCLWCGEELQGWSRLDVIQIEIEEWYHSISDELTEKIRDLVDEDHYTKKVEDVARVLSVESEPLEVKREAGEIILQSWEFTIVFDDDTEDWWVYRNTIDQPVLLNDEYDIDGFSDVVNALCSEYERIGYYDSHGGVGDGE